MQLKNINGHYDLTYFCIKKVQNDIVFEDIKIG